MARHGWGTGHPVADWLLEEGYRFEFVQAVRLLEMMQPERIAPAEGSNAAKEPVRFRASNSLAFPASELAEVRPAARTDPHGRPEMVVNFMGLAGALGPLPLPFTERILERVREKDTAPRDFLDIFNHRLLSLFYRVRRKHRLGIEWRSPELHQFADYLYAMVGLETGGLRNRLKIPDRALLRYAGLLARRPRSTSALCVVLADFFALPVVDRQLQGAFRPFDEDQWTRLGETGQNQVLGLDAKLGTQLWDQQAGIVLELGPLPFSRYLDFLPARGGFVALCQLVRFYIGPMFDFAVRLLVKGEEIAPACLSAQDPSPVQPADSAGGGCRLGWTSWLTIGRPLKGVMAVDIAHVERFADRPPTPQATVS